MAAEWFEFKTKETQYFSFAQPILLAPYVSDAMHCVAYTAPGSGIQIFLQERDFGSGGNVPATGFEVENYLFTPQRDRFVAHFHLAGSAPLDDGTGSQYVTCLQPDSRCKIIYSHHNEITSSPTFTWPVLLLAMTARGQKI
jgi:hypothetical protein